MSDEDVWGKGEYYRVAERLMPLAEAVVDAAKVDSLQLVLDVGAGTGNVSVAAAERHATVTAIDPSPGMVELGEQRTIGANVEWHEGSVEALPFDDGHFDATLSVMAAVFAPDAQRAADEMLRVTKPGGALVFTAWCADGLMADLTGVVSQATGGPGIVNAWHDEAFIRSTLAAAADVTVERRTLHWEFDSIDATLEYFERGPGPMIVAQERLGPERWAEVRAQARSLIETHGSTVIEPPYLLITARR